VAVRLSGSTLIVKELPCDDPVVVVLCEPVPVVAVIPGELWKREDSFGMKKTNPSTRAATSIILTILIATHPALLRRAGVGLGIVGVKYWPGKVAGSTWGVEPGIGC